MHLKGQQIRLATTESGDRSFQLIGKAAVEIGDIRATADQVDAALTKERSTIRWEGNVHFENDEFLAIGHTAELDTAHRTLRVTAREGEAVRLQRAADGDKVQIEASVIQFDGKDQKIRATGAVVLDLGL